MNKNESKHNTDTDSNCIEDKDYHMRGLALAARMLFTTFLVWCTFHYPMSDTMRNWFFVWAVLTWLCS